MTKTIYPISILLKIYTKKYTLFYLYSKLYTIIYTLFYLYYNIYILISIFLYILLNIYNRLYKYFTIKGEFKIYIQNYIFKNTKIYKYKSIL